MLLFIRLKQIAIDWQRVGAHPLFIISLRWRKVGIRAGSEPGIGRMRPILIAREP